jgi:hypothetical protein
MFKSFQEIRSHIDGHGIQMVDLKFCDLWGRWRHITVPAPQFLPSIMEEGIGFDGSSVGFRSVESGDMVLVPDLTTGAPDPFWDVPTLSFICRPSRRTPSGRSPSDPRDVAARAEAYLNTTGIADRACGGRSSSSTCSTTSASRAAPTCRQLPRRLEGGGLEQRRGGVGPPHPAPRRLPRHPAAGPALQPARRDHHAARRHGRAREVPPPRGGRAGAARDRDAHGGDHGRRRHDHDR